MHVLMGGPRTHSDIRKLLRHTDEEVQLDDVLKAIANPRFAPPPPNTLLDVLSKLPLS
jgi:hypothetical protein